MLQVKNLSLEDVVSVTTAGAFMPVHIPRYTSTNSTSGTIRCSSALSGKLTRFLAPPDLKITEILKIVRTRDRFHLKVQTSFHKKFTESIQIYQRLIY